MVLCCGEALIDLLPGRTASGEPCFVPRTGGSPFNVALALARLGVPTAFFCRISEDFFGDKLVSRLEHERVDVSFIRRVAKPTTLAFIDLNASNEPRYAFYFNDSADRSLTTDQLPPRLDNVECLQFGSISLTMEPGATALEALVAREADQRVVSFDPNIRATMIADKNAYLRRFEGWAHASTVIKLSAVDLEYLYPGQPCRRALDQLAATAMTGPRTRPLLLVATLGESGSVAVLHHAGTSRSAEVSGFAVSVADTIGAGDTFHSGLLRWLQARQLLSFSGIASLGETDLGASLRYANACAALTCTRNGADPPTAREVDEFLTKS